MRTKSVGLVMTALFAFAASGQTPAQQSVDRVFRFAHTEAAQNFQEIATLIGAIADIRQVSTDNAQGALTLRGTVDQIALAEWLFYGLDQPAYGQQDSAQHEFRLSGSSENVVRVLYLVHNQTAAQLQEIATLIRSMAAIRRLFTYNAQRALALRGTADQIAMAEWLFNELDKPPNGPWQHGIRAWTHAPAGSEDVTRVFYCAHAETTQDLQEIATLIRSVAEIRRLFTCNAQKSLALRGTAEQVAMAEWLFNELDKPASGQLPTPQGQNPAAHEYRASDSGGDLVRVFYLNHAGTAQDLQKVAVQIRKATDVQRLFTYNAQRAVALCGTADQIALAERLLRKASINE